MTRGRSVLNWCRQPKSAEYRARCAEKVGQWKAEIDQPISRGVAVFLLLIPGVLVFLVFWGQHINTTIVRGSALNLSVGL